MAKKLSAGSQTRAANKNKQERKWEIIGLLLIGAGILGLLSLLGLQAGSVGQMVARLLTFAFGMGAMAIPLLIILIGGFYIGRRKPVIYSARFWGIVLLYIAVLAIIHHFWIPERAEILPESLSKGGGLVGGFTLFLLRKLFGYYGTLVVTVTIALCSIVVAFRLSVYSALAKAGEKAQAGLSNAYDTIEKAGKFYNQEKDKRWRQKEEQYAMVDNAEEQVVPLAASSELPMPAEAYEAIEEAAAATGQLSEVQTEHRQLSRLPVKAAKHAGDKLNKGFSIQGGNCKGYKLPPLSLLKKAMGQADNRRVQEINNNAKVLETTLASFNVKARIINISQGPTVTRYELEPAPGTKVSKFVSLADDIALSLAASGVRIEAPIPGKAAIGIEVPNKTVASVTLREVIECKEFQQSSSPLVVALGKDIAGQTVTTDLSKMPHLLVAGSTGSGKSVCVNTLITSVLFRAKPDEVKFILVDPKVVELTNYNGLPHLLTPVVTEAEKAASALRWAVQEMERRYALFAAGGVRDIARYNEQIEKYPSGEGSSGEKIPYIVIIIDELADLMMVAPVDVEDAIIRLAQKARAAGIHMVLATQRPSVDVITGLIKANVPSRIAFAVSSQVDSRTILDMAGAEKLLGKGDMLFAPMGAPKPLRVQGAFISDSEVEDLTGYIKEQAEQPEYVAEVTAAQVLTKEEKDQGVYQDDLLEDAVRMILETRQASTSMLQRKFRIGYTRASRIIDTLEEMKIIGPNTGSKPREILMTAEQIYSRYFNSNDDANA